jgi:hypothetical protein
MDSLTLFYISEWALQQTLISSPYPLKSWVLDKGE